jgi:hypothetical protein
MKEFSNISILANKNLTLQEEADWMDYFTKKKAEALALQAEIDRLDREIDEMVYDLYGLTDLVRRSICEGAGGEKGCGGR